MGLLKKAFKGVTKLVKGGAELGLATVTGGLSLTKQGKNIVKGIESNPLQAAMLAGATVATGGIAGAIGASALTAGAAMATVGAYGAKSLGDSYVAEQKAKKEQAAYDAAVTAEAERKRQQNRQSLLSLRKQYTKNLTRSAQGGGSSDDDLLSGGTILG